MSIWVYLCSIGAGYDESAGPLEQVRSWAAGLSNHYPATGDLVEHASSIDLAQIPAWCAGGADDDFDTVGPWLRLGVRTVEHDLKSPEKVNAPVEAVVVMDEEAARLLVVELTAWLERPKISPVVDKGGAGV